MQTKRMLACVTVAVVTGISICAPARAAAEWQIIGYRGDLSGDGTINCEDVLRLCGHLTNASPCTEPEIAQLGDMNSDRVWNAADLTLLKRAVLAGDAPEPIYATEKPPIAAVNPTMPTRGTVRVPMFFISFPDCPQTTGLSATQLQQRSFRPADPTSLSYPFESLTGYFDRASYGRLKLEGDVYEYTAEHPIAHYVQTKDLLLAEMLGALDAEIDYTDYDADADGVIDTLIAVVPENAGEAWRALSGVYKGGGTFDGLKVGRRSVGRYDADSCAAFHSTWAHELSHTMGLPDYYKYTESEDGIYGMHGDAGWELMDDGFGDLSAFSKLMLGWYDANEVQVYTGGTQTFQLESAQTAPGCILIPRGALNGYMSEYFVLEYDTDAGNNAHQFVNGRIYPLFAQGGLRVLHCDAELWDGTWGPELKWNNYGQLYDTSNQKQRVLRLANDAAGGAFFAAGATVDGQICGFRWYDSAGDQTVDVGVQITVDSIADGVCSVTVRAVPTADR